MAAPAEPDAPGALPARTSPHFERRTLAPGPCPDCGHSLAMLFYRLDGVPVQSNILLDERADALAVPRGDVHLAACPGCGSIRNVAFDPRTQEHSARYEVTQGFSGSFSSFLGDLARRVVDRFDLRGKTVVEIGCGAGEFLAALCTIGGNRGYGIDPSTDPSRMPAEVEGITLLREYWSEGHAALEPDLICCRHTLEHIHDAGAFLDSIRRAIGDRPDVPVVFEVPDAGRILRAGAFWDIYYEHCGYYGADALRRVFALHGFGDITIETIFDDQYLLLTALPARHRPEPAGARPEAPVIETDLASFERMAQAGLQSWRRRLDARGARRIALWGSGSKAVGFLVSLGGDHAVDCVVDINPHRQGRFVPGTGHPIVAPEALRGRRPDLVIIMNPVYTGEIRQELDRMGLHPELCAV